MPEDDALRGPLVADRLRHRFFAGPEQFRGDEVVLSPGETHHLSRVLRLPPGSRVEVADGCGRLFSAEILGGDSTSARLRLLKELAVGFESALEITLGLALVRAETFDLIVRQATEMGISRLAPFYAAHSLVRPEGWRQSRLERWQRLARTALKSSQREVLPEIMAPVEFGQVLEGPEEIKLLFWEAHREQAGTVDVKSLPRPRRVRALIGPEGGFSPEEVTAARQAGFLVLGLGPRRLRVETAALAAVSVLQYLWGDLAT